MRRDALRGGLGALALAVLTAFADHQRSQPVNRAAKGWPLAPFQLQDAEGTPLTRTQLLGRWTFVLLGDTRCEPPCREALAALAGLRERVARTEVWRDTQLVFVSLDPAHDTPARLRSHRASMLAGVLVATGTPAMLHQLVDDLALARHAVDTTADPRGALVLIGPDAVLRVEYLPPFDVKLLTADYLITRARR